MLDWMASSVHTAGMSEQPTIRDQIVRAMDGSGLSRYAISQATGIHESTLSRFAAGERGLSWSALESLAELLQLEIKPRKPGRG